MKYMRIIKFKWYGWEKSISKKGGGGDLHDFLTGHLISPTY